MSRRSPTAFDRPVAPLARTPLVALPEDLPVAAAIERVREATHDPLQPLYIYAVDAEGRLCGVVPVRRLVLAAPDQAVGDIAVREIVSLPHDATVGEAYARLHRHRLLAIPLVDDDDRLRAVVEVAAFSREIDDLVRRQAFADAFQLVGVHLALGRQSALAGFRDRFPWLATNIAGGLVCALLVAVFEELVAAAIVLAFFVPVVLTVSESVSIQSMTLTLEMLHGRPRRRELGRALLHEFGVAFLLGAGAGSVVGLVAWAWRAPAPLAFGIGLAILCAIVTACLLGVLLPFAVHALRHDPRIAAGPIVLATADVATLLLYFGIARLILA